MISCAFHNDCSPIVVDAVLIWEEKLITSQNFQNSNSHHRTAQCVLNPLENRNGKQRCFEGLWCNPAIRSRKLHGVLRACGTILKVGTESYMLFWGHVVRISRCRNTRGHVVQIFGSRMASCMTLWGHVAQVSSSRNMRKRTAFENAPSGGYCRSAASSALLRAPADRLYLYPEPLSLLPLSWIWLGCP